MPSYEADTERRRARLLAKYGMTLDDFDLLLVAQDYSCAICGKRFSTTRVACVEHDHDTGVVRGLACGPCNYTLGHLHEDVEWLRRARNHLLTPIAERVFDTPRRHVDAPPEVS